MNTDGITQAQDEAAVIREKIKDRPINKRRLLRRTLVSAALALIFGLVACLTFLLLEPFFSERLSTDETPAVITFPTTEDEIQPEDLYADDAEIAAAQEQIVAETVAESVQASIEAGEQDRVNAAIDQALSRLTMDEGDADDIYRSLKAIVSRAERSLTLVRAASTGSDFVGGVLEKSGEAPGIIVADNGVDVLILTYSSILSEDSTLTVTWCSGSTNSASLKMADPDSGLCVLSVPKRRLDNSTAKQIAIASLGSSISTSLTGTPIIAVGSPIGIYKSVCYGMIASEKTAVDLPDKALKVYATDITGATEARGFLLNYSCQVVGVIYPEKLVNVDSDRILAYSITESKKLIEHLVNAIPFTVMGIHGVNLTEEDARELTVEPGAYVLRVDMDSPAMSGGLQSGDIITAIDDKPVSSWDALAAAIEAVVPGADARLNILRQGPEGYLSMQLTVETNS